MNRLSILFILWLLAALPSSAAEIPQRTIFNLAQPFDLKGDWLFTGPDHQSQIISLPSGWEKRYKRRLPYYGKGKYHLKLVFAPELVGQVLQLNTDHIGGGKFRFWLNDQLIGHNGSTLSSLSRRPYFKPFVLTQREQILRVEVENQTFHLSGLVRPLWIGQAEQIAHRHTQFLINRNLILGVFLFMGLIHVIMYLFFLPEKSLLWFGITCLMASFYAELYQSHNFEYLFGDLPLPWSIRLTRAAVSLLFPSFLLYSYYLSDHYVSRRFVQLITGVSLIFLTVFLISEKVYSYLIGPWFVMILGCITYNFYLMFRFAQKHWAWAFILSGVAFGLTLINDLLNILGLLQTAIVARYGLLCFCFTQAGLLAIRFQQSYHKALFLQEELLEVNENLDNLVQARTAEVRSKNEELQQLARFKDDMTHMLAHDLKTPLNTLVNLPPANLAELQIQIQTQSRHMLKLINHMLVTRQWEHHELKLSLQPVKLAALLQKVFENVLPWAQSKKISLKTQISPKLEFQLDTLLFERVLQNLLDNAIKHTPAGGQIEVDCHLSVESLNILITDSGPGIPPERLELIFEQHQSFAQSDVPRSSGLGLYFCRQVIEAHQGKITARNKPKGGCQIVIDLVLPQAQTYAQPANWSEEQLQVLRPLAQQLQSQQVYAVTHIQSLLQKISAPHDPLIQNWLSAVEYAVSEVNEKHYASLITQITQYSDR